MASDFLLEIDGVKGESKDKQYPGTIDLQSFSWGMDNAANLASGGGGGSGKANVHDVSFVKNLDKASCELMAMCANGKHIKKVVFHVRKQGEKALEYYKVELNECLVSSYQLSNASGAETPMEHFSLCFAKFKCEYKEQLPDGSGKAAGDVSWNCKANAPA